MAVASVSLSTPAPAPSTSPAALGVFLASDDRGPDLLPGFEAWLGLKVTVGRTYLPGERWKSLEGGDSEILDTWTRWRAAQPGRVLALNVPMVTPNESGMSDRAVARKLAKGAHGAHDGRFRKLAGKLVSSGAADTIIVLGWEMNGTTYSSRCGPDPEAWKQYWRRIVQTMRETPGQRFRFDFAPSRGSDAVPWTDCYPGDDVVDIIGMDSYDQGPGHEFADYVEQPYGLRAHADFAAQHGKPISFPEWGLFRNGDRPAYVEGMLDWISTHNVVYHSISDYCPHGVWQCSSNPGSSEAFRRRLLERASLASMPSVCAASPSSALSTPNPAASAAAAAPSAAASAGCPSLTISASASPAPSSG
ncbi:glycosyl hydrolase [Nonomuraea angiospora]